jgi:acyl dehydratase
VGLPGVIAHGMFTMGAAVQLVTDWAGDPAAVVDFQTRFTKPVPVADTTGTPEAGAVIEVSGAIGALDADAGTARVDLTVVSAGQKVLVKAQAVVRLA